MYWFHEGGAVLSTVMASNAKTLAEGWWTASRPAAQHDAALMSVLATAIYDPQIQEAEAWLAALQRWQEAHSSTEYWDYVHEVERMGGFPVEATEQDADEVYGKTAGVVGEILGGIARDSVAAGDTARCARALHVLRSARHRGLSPEEVARLEEEVIGPLEDGLDSRCKTLRAKCNDEIQHVPEASTDNRTRCDLFAAEYETEIAPRVSVLLQLVDSTSESRERVRSTAANCLRAVAVAWTWADQFRAAEYTAERALGLALGTPLESDLRQLVVSLRPVEQPKQQQFTIFDDESSGTSAEEGGEEDMVEGLNEIESIDHESEPSAIGARPWVRYWARFLDLSWGTLAVQIFLLIAFPELLQHSTALTLVSLLGFVPVEAALMSLFGTTPGKWVLNVRLRKEDGARVDFKQAFRRGLLVWWRGLGAGVPIVSLFTLVTAHDRLKNAGSTSWDDDCGCVVTHGPVGFGRSIAATAVIVGLMLLRVMPWS